MLLIHYVENLKKVEFESFKAYLKLQYNRTPIIQLSLLTYLGKYIIHSNKPEMLSSANIAIQVFKGNSKSHHNKVNDNASEILKKLKFWLAYQELKKEQLWQYLLLSDSLSKKNMHKEFMELSQDFTDQLQASNHQDMASLYAQLAIKKAMYHHPSTEKITRKNSLLDDSLEALELFYVLNKLRLGIEKKYFRNSIVQEEKDNLLNDWDNLLTKASFLEDNLVLLYLDLIKILENLTENEHLIQELWQKVIATESKIAPSDLQFIAISLVNCCNKLIVKGKKEYYNSYLEIYLHGLENGYLSEGDKISSATFKNISFGLALRQDEKMFEDFILQYKLFLESDGRQNIVLLARTYYHCFAKKFDAALDLLNQIQKPDTVTKYSSYLLQINIFMEQLLDKADYADLISSKIEAFRQFISRDQTLSASKKEAYHNYLLIITSIFNYVYAKKPNGKQKIVDQINEMNPLVSRDWLNSLASRI